MTPAASAMSRTVVASSRAGRTRRPRPESGRDARSAGPRPARPSAAGPRPRCEPADDPRSRRPSWPGRRTAGQDAVRHLVRPADSTGQPDLGDGPVEHVPQDPACTEGSIASSATAALIRRRQYRSTLAGSVRTTVRRLELAVPGASNTLSAARPGAARTRWRSRARTGGSRPAGRPGRAGTRGPPGPGRRGSPRPARPRWLPWTRSGGTAARQDAGGGRTSRTTCSRTRPGRQPAAARKISSRRRFRPPNGVLGTEDGDTVTRPYAGARPRTHQADARWRRPRISVLRWSSLAWSVWPWLG